MSLTYHEIPGGSHAYERNFLTEEEGTALLESALAFPEWSRDTFKKFGEVHLAKRQTIWFGDPGAIYRYAGVTRHPLPWPTCLATVRDRVRERVGQPFNGALANLYADGKERLGWHADAERDLVPDPVIASVSVGATRRFLLRNIECKELQREFELEHGSLFVMGAGTQSHWKHRAPEAARCTEPRVNFTFRCVIVRPTG